MGNTSGTRSESKSTLKFEKKVQFDSKVKDSVSTLSSQKSITKKKSRQQRQQIKKMKAYNLSTLLDSLPKFVASQKSAPRDSFKLVNLGRRYCESVNWRKKNNCLRFVTVLISNWIPSLRQLLLGTQPVEERPKIKKANKNGSKKKSKASTRGQYMDM